MFNNGWSEWVGTFGWSLEQMKKEKKKPTKVNSIKRKVKAHEKAEDKKYKELAKMNKKFEKSIR